ncbi:MAG: PLP-dependent aminotransferase family protein [Clostridia bacterium]
MDTSFSKRSQFVKASEIRELLKLTEQKGLISFAGGLPAMELFPVNELVDICTKVLLEKGGAALQYSATEGIVALREQLAKLMQQAGITVNADQVLVTTGSQQVLDLAGKVFLDEGDVIFCESPTYLAAISSFNAYLPKFIEIETDSEGIVPENLLLRLQEFGKPKFLYVIPDYQNPSGRSMSIDRRKTLIEIANTYDFIIIEDNPYGEVSFETSKKPTLKSLDTDGRVIYTSSLSKTFSPGLRLGWVTATDIILRKFILFKQGADLHTNTLAQMIAAEYLNSYDYPRHLQKIRATYKLRRNAMCKALNLYLPQVKFIKPEGGIFLWGELPEQINSCTFLEHCIEKKVAFVPGGSFFPEKRQENTMRLNFSFMSEETITDGVFRMGEAYMEMQESLLLK